MFNREQNHLLQLFFSILKTTNILPLNIRNLDNSFSQGGWVYLSHSKFEVVLSDSHGLKDLSVDLLVLNIDDVHFLSNTL